MIFNTTIYKDQGNSGEVGGSISSSVVGNAIIDKSAIGKEFTNPGVAGDVLVGKEVYDQNGDIITGTMPSVVQATPSISVSAGGLVTASATQSAGYVTEGTKIATSQLPTQTGSIITPGVIEKIAVAAGKYTTGDIKVAGDSNLIASNIKSGISIFGVNGALEMGTGSSDTTATATVSDILLGKTAWANGAKLTGTTSIAGIHWQETTLPFSGSWSGVAYGDGKFVLISNASDKAAYSIDGITWIETSMPFNGYWNAITYGNGKFVAIAYLTNKAAYSINGIDWTETTLPSNDSWMGVTYGNGRFITTVWSGTDNQSYKAAYSIDGITWTQITLPFHRGNYGISYGEGKFFILPLKASSSDLNQFVYTSIDGINWTQLANPVTPSSVYWSNVICGNGKLVAFGMKSGDPSLFYTHGIKINNSITWSYDELAIPYQSPYILSYMIYIGGKYIAYSTNTSDRIYYSEEANYWSKITIPSGAWRAFGYGNGTFVAFQNDKAIVSFNKYYN